MSQTTIITGFCYVNQRSYRIGETTVELLDGNIFYRCTCRLSFEGRAQRNCSHSSKLCDNKTLCDVSDNLTDKYF